MTMKEKIKIEEGFLETTESLVTDLLKKHFETPDCQLDAFTKSKMSAFCKAILHFSMLLLFGSDHKVILSKIEPSNITGSCVIYPILLW